MYRIILYSYLILLFFVSPSYGQPVFGAADDSVSTNTDTDSITGFTTTGSNIMMVVGTGCEDATSLENVSSVVWDSAGLNQSFTQAGTALEHTNGTINMAVWYLANATAASSKIITITYDGTCASGIISIGHYYTNASNEAPEVSIKAQATNSSAVTDEITTLTNNAMMVSFVEGSGSGTDCNDDHGDGQTQATVEVGSVMGNCSTYETQPTAGAEDMSTTLTGTTDWIQATISIVEFTAAAGARRVIVVN